MQAAKNAKIDAFALNIGTDSWSGDQIGFAFNSAGNNSMNAFISFDFNWYHIDQTDAIGAMLKQYASHPAYLKISGKPVVSSFQGDGLKLDDVASAAGFARTDLFFMPYFQPGALGSVDAGFNWMAWPNNGNNKAPDASGNKTVAQGDSEYFKALQGRPYMAPVSPWFSTHYGLEVNYSKNWVFPGDSLWYDRWSDILVMDPQPQFLEIITWNDYGEGSYVAPLSSPHYDDGGSKWVNDMPHDGFLEMAKPYIAAFKAGSKTISVETDQIIYWYRPHLKSASCSDTDTCEKPWPGPSPNPNYFVGKPNGAETMEDDVFVVALLTADATVQVNSGSSASPPLSGKAGPNFWRVAMGVGKQSFSVTRPDGGTVLSGTSPKDIIADCVCGIYNFNAFVGTLPAGPADALQADGLSRFTVSLQGTCQPTPSLSAPIDGVVNPVSGTGGPLPLPTGSGSPIGGPQVLAEVVPGPLMSGVTSGVSGPAETGLQDYGVDHQVLAEVVPQVTGLNDYSLNGVPTGGPQVLAEVVPPVNGLDDYSLNSVQTSGPQVWTKAAPQVPFVPVAAAVAVATTSGSTGCNAMTASTFITSGGSTMNSGGSTGCNTITASTFMTSGGSTGSKTITASSQIFPTNCLQPGYVWAGPAGSDPPAYCDVG